MTTQAPSAPEGLTLPEKVIEHIRVSDIALEKAAAAEQKQTEKQAAVAKLIPQVCDAMITHNRARPDQREKLASLLADPAEALNLLIKVAGHRNDDELARLGQGASVDGTIKTAGDKTPSSSLNSAYVGGRSTGRVKESSARLFSALGLAVPESEA